MPSAHSYGSGSSEQRSTSFPPVLAPDPPRVCVPGISSANPTRASADEVVSSPVPRRTAERTGMWDGGAAERYRCPMLPLDLGSELPLKHVTVRPENPVSGARSHQFASPLHHSRTEPYSPLLLSPLWQRAHKMESHE